MSEQEIIREEEIFFSFETGDALYELVRSQKNTIPYGSILNKKESRREILIIEDWVRRFVVIFGYNEHINIEDIYSTLEADDDSILFNGPFGSLRISGDYNLTYERSST